MKKRCQGSEPLYLDDIMSLTERLRRNVGSSVGEMLFGSVLLRCRDTAPAQLHDPLPTSKERSPNSMA